MFRRFESSASSSAAGFLAHTSMRRGILSILQTNSEAVTGFLRVVPSFRGGGVFLVFSGVPGFWRMFLVFWVFRDVPVFRVPVSWQYYKPLLKVRFIYFCTVRLIFV